MFFEFSQCRNILRSLHFLISNILNKWSNLVHLNILKWPSLSKLYKSDIASCVASYASYYSVYILTFSTIHTSVAIY